MPPLHSPQCATGLKFRCGGIAPVQCHLGGSFPPMREALYCHARQVTAKTESHRQKMGRPPKKAALLEGSGEGNEKFPSPPFLSPVSFPRKEIGSPLGKRPARRAQKFPSLAGYSQPGNSNSTTIPTTPHPSIINTGSGFHLRSTKKARRKRTRAGISGDTS